MLRFLIKNFFAVSIIFWFFLLNKHKNYYPKLGKNERNIKFWIPIHLERKKSGLIVSENSHKKNFKFIGQLYANKESKIKNRDETKGHVRPFFDFKKNGHSCFCKGMA